jgi:hypothetical protein
VPTGPAVQVGLYLDGQAQGVYSRDNLYVDVSQGVFIQYDPVYPAKQNTVVAQHMPRVEVPVAREQAVLNALAANGTVLQIDYQDAPLVSANAGPSTSIRTRWAQLLGMGPPSSIPTGLFQFSNGGIGYSDASSGRYCAFSSWSSFVAWSGLSSTDGIPSYPHVPPGQVYSGACPLAGAM